MFTGIITAIGTIAAITPTGAGYDTRLRVASPPDFLAAHGGTEIGASIACSGICLTAIELTPTSFDVEVSAETLTRGHLGLWHEGTRINLERSLRVGDELGGHIVSGHVDGLATIETIAPEAGSHRMVFTIPTTLAPFVAEKGSVAVDGISLTVNEVGLHLDGKHWFAVNVIPHSWTNTTLGLRGTGDPVHIEIDMLARYVARLAQFGSQAGPGEQG